MAQSESLYSVVLQLTPTAEVAVRATMGHQIHAAFLDAVHRADPDLADTLHLDDDSRRPFTVSALQGVPRARRGQVHLSPERPCWLRFTILLPPIFEQFMARFLHAGNRPTIRLGPAELLIREILVTPGSHRWAGYTSWEALREGSAPDAKVALEFVSPTAFSRGQQDWGKKFHLLPDPVSVFADSLLEKWNTWAPAGLELEEESLRAYLEEDVVVRRLEDLHTAMWRYPRHIQVGFVGRVTYGFQRDVEAIRRQLNALAGLAFYSGVGYKTTMGMGQVRRV